MAESYYAEELTAVPFGVLRDSLGAFLPRPLAFGLAAWLRLRGMVRWFPAPASAGGNPGSETVLERGAMPARALSRWAPSLEQLGDLGFRTLRFSVADLIGRKEQAEAVLVDGPGSTLALLSWIRMPSGTEVGEKTTLELNSFADNDPEIMTARVKKEDVAMAGMLKLDFIDVLVLPDRLSVGEVYQRHAARCSGRALRRMSPESALEENRRRQERRFAWAVGQGLLRCLTEAEVARLRRLPWD